MANAAATSPRPRTPGRSTSGQLSPTEPDALPPPPPAPPQAQPAVGARRSSFNFLRRGKSVERLSTSKRSISGGKLSKKHAGELSPTGANAIAPRAPTIPDVVAPPKLAEFGGENARPTPQSQSQQLPGAGVPRASMQESVRHASLASRDGGRPDQAGGAVDPYARTGSMTHRGRYSYASSAVSSYTGPRRVRRRKDPTPFNVLVIGARNSGKTAFIDFLRASLALPPRKQRPHAGAHLPPGVDPTQQPPASQRRNPASFVSHYLETETGDGERVGLTLWDSEGLDRAVVDLQLREVTAFLESKFEDTFGEETKVVRAPGAWDTHIHCVLLVLDPVRLAANIKAARAAVPGGGAADGGKAGGTRLANGRGPGAGPASAAAAAAAPVPGLDEQLDLQVLRALQGKTTVIPVISKADTVTVAQMGRLKRAVYLSLQQAKLDPFEALGGPDDDDDDDDEEEDEEDEDDADGDDVAVPGGNTGLPPTLVAGAGASAKHNRHNSRRFDERDEDRLLQPGHPDPPATVPANANADDGPMTAHLDTSSTTTSGSSPPAAGASAPSATPTAAPTRSAPEPPLPPLPLSVLSPEEPGLAHAPGPGRVGRRFAWGSADPYDAAHCDFGRLKALVFEEWRAELREASREVWYEGWRTSRLHAPGAGLGGAGGAGAGAGAGARGRYSAGAGGPGGRASGGGRIVSGASGQASSGAGRASAGERYRQAAAGPPGLAR